MAHPKPHEPPPVPAEILEPLDPAERERALAEAEAEIVAGGGAPQDEVGRWLLELAAGRQSPPPCGRG